MAVELTGGTPATNNKLMVLGHGYPGVGKSALGLSFPTPHYVFNLDRPLDNLIEKLPTAHKVVLEDAPQDVDAASRAVAQSYLTKFDALMKRALTEGGDGTAMIDGWDIFWDLVKIAKVANLDSDLPKEYAPANAYMNQWLGRLGRSRLNVYFTTVSSRVWTGAKTETERVRADGFKHKDRMLTHEVYMFSPEDRRNPFEVPKGGDSKTPGSLGQTHQALITMSKLNENLINKAVPNLSYSLLYRLTFGKAYPEPARLWSPAASAVAAPKDDGANS